MNYNFKDGLRDAIQLLAVVAIFGGILIVAFSAVAAISMPISITACNTWQAANPQLEFRYDWLVGCMVKTPTGIWLSSENVQYINGTILLQQP